MKPPCGTFDMCFNNKIDCCLHVHALFQKPWVSKAKHPGYHEQHLLNWYKLMQRSKFQFPYDVCQPWVTILTKTSRFLWNLTNRSRSVFVKPGKLVWIDFLDSLKISRLDLFFLKFRKLKKNWKNWAINRKNQVINRNNRPLYHFLFKIWILNKKLAKNCLIKNRLINRQNHLGFVPNFKN
jgi:hypothetical protein